MPKNQQHPAFAEEQIINEEKLNLQEILSQLPQPISTHFLKLELEEGNYCGSTNPKWKNKPLSEKYFFIHEGKEIWIDIPHTIMEELGLEKGKDIAQPLYLDPNVLTRPETYRGITIEEGEILLQQPFIINKLEQNLTKLFKQIEKLEAEKQENLETIAKLKKELTEKERDRKNEHKKTKEGLRKNEEVIQECLRKIDVLEKENKELEQRIKELEKVEKKTEKERNNKRSWESFLNWLNENIFEERDNKFEVGFGSSREESIRGELGGIFPQLGGYEDDDSRNKTRVEIFIEQLNLLKKENSVRFSEFIKWKDVELALPIKSDKGRYGGKDCQERIIKEKEELLTIYSRVNELKRKTWDSFFSYLSYYKGVVIDEDKVIFPEGEEPFWKNKGYDLETINEIKNSPFFHNFLSFCFKEKDNEDFNLKSNAYCWDFYLISKVVWGWEKGSRWEDNFTIEKQWEQEVYELERKLGREFDEIKDGNWEKTKLIDKYKMYLEREIEYLGETHHYNKKWDCKVIYFFNRKKAERATEEKLKEIDEKLKKFFNEMEGEWKKEVVEKGTRDRNPPLLTQLLKVEKELEGAREKLSSLSK